jgi:hypothetical protein
MGDFGRPRHQTASINDGTAFGRNRSNGWHYPGANSFARYSEEGNLLKPITWQSYHLSNT